MVTVPAGSPVGSLTSLRVKRVMSTSSSKPPGVELFGSASGGRKVCGLGGGAAPGRLNGKLNRDWAAASVLAIAMPARLIRMRLRAPSIIFPAPTAAHRVSRKLSRIGGFVKRRHRPNAPLPSASARRNNPFGGSGGTTMTLRLHTAILTAILGFSSAAGAQQANPLDVIPDKMPFNIPYGAPISLTRAQAAIAAATAEAEKHGWALNVAVVDSGANLVAFGRMDGAQLGSIAVSEHKARTAAKFRRPTKAFEEAIQKGNNYALTIDDVMGSRGGIPLVEDGKLIGAIGCSGGAGSQDEVACTAGAATINK